MGKLITRCGKDFSARFRRDSRGTAGVEFALIIPVYLAIVLSMMEVGWLATKTAMLDYAVGNAAKFIYTGAAQTGTPSKSDIEEFICDKAVVIKDCEENISVEATTIKDFESFPKTRAQCRDSANPDFKPSVKYDNGGSAEIVFLRVCITTDLFTPGLGIGLSLPKTDTNRYQVVSTVAFMNEPF